jgi:hypothetical protein
MGISVARISAELDQVYCPFTGGAIHGDDGVSPLPSLLFVYYGGAGLYGYTSDRLVKLLEDRGIACSADDMPLEPDEIAQKLDLENAFILEIDTGWNGVNSYGFVVPEVPEE